MKFYASIAVRVCMIWLGFKLDLGHSSDPGTGFTPDFWISAVYLEKLWTDFDEIEWVDSRGGLDELIIFLSWIHIIVQIQEPDLHRIF